MGASTSLSVPTTLGRRLRHYREVAELSREVAAARSSADFRTSCCWESGSRTPNLTQLRELAALYRVAVIDLLDADDHGPARRDGMNASATNARGHHIDNWRGAAPWVLTAAIGDLGRVVAQLLGGPAHQILVGADGTAPGRRVSGVG